MFKERLSALVPEWELDEVTMPERLPRGLNNHNFAFDYQGAPYVLRVGRAGFRVNPAESEAWALPRLALPELVAADWRRGDLLTKRIDAPCLAEVDATLAELGEFLQTLHSALPERFCRDYPLDEMLRSQQGLPASMARRVSRLKAVKPVKEACHNDLNAWNILAATQIPSRWIALDWEWAGNGSRLFDAVNLALFLGYGAENAHRLSARCGYLDPNKYGHFEQMVERYWLREYSFAASEIAAGRDSPFLEEQMEKCLLGLAEI